jgi:hypothetical protein
VIDETARDEPLIPAVSESVVRFPPESATYKVVAVAELMYKAADNSKH